MEECVLSDISVLSWKCRPVAHGSTARAAAGVATVRTRSGRWVVEPNLSPPFFMPGRRGTEATLSFSCAGRLMPGSDSMESEAPRSYSKPRGAIRDLDGCGG